MLRVVALRDNWIRGRSLRAPARHKAVCVLPISSNPPIFLCRRDSVTNNFLSENFRDPDSPDRNSKNFSGSVIRIPPSQKRRSDSKSHLDSSFRSLRRRRDSNPRGLLHPTSLAVRRLRPAQPRLLGRKINTNVSRIKPTIISINKPKIAIILFHKIVLVLLE